MEAPRRQPVELRALLVVAGLLAALWGASAAVGAMLGEAAYDLDQLLLLGLRDAQDPARLRGPSWVASAARDVTALGGSTVLTLVTAAVAGYLALRRSGLAALLVVAAWGGGLAWSRLIKLLVSRPRPSAVPHLVEVTSASWPSGHAMQAAAVYLALATIVAALDPRRAVKLHVMAVALGITLLVGASRVVLGVHYPSDVLAGWLGGVLWALACAFAVRRAYRRRRRPT
ncbi:MAG TPA: phosphatase PAP2 family protein [Thermoanaerobaculia bacterium]|nr:phosphatase PAP2 family protein [Thermoanaerobaculia bacterium]